LNVRGARVEIEAATQIDRGDDLAAQIDEAAHNAWGERNRGHANVTEDLLDAAQFDAEEKTIEIEGAKLGSLRHG